MQVLCQVIGPGIAGVPVGSGGGEEGWDELAPASVVVASDHGGYSHM